jgi:hypothetical protein
MRRFRAGLVLVAAAATAGCSILIGVSGDPVVVDDEGGNAQADAAAESGDEAHSTILLDAAALGETEAGD